jgi:hypothetical protein
MKSDIEVMQVPVRFTELADRRTGGLIVAAAAWPDALRVIARSCYLQGMADAQEVYERGNNPDTSNAR